MATITVTKGYNDPTGFTSGETITPAKLNSAQSPTAAITFVTADDTDDSTLEVSGNKFRVKNDGVVTAKIADANVTQAKLAAGVAGNGPAFRAYLGTNLNLGTGGAYGLLQIDTETFDTNSNFNTTNYRFTPSVSGYYQINGAVRTTTGTEFLVAAIFKNGSLHSLGDQSNALRFVSTVADVIYFNGSTDYVELRAAQSSGVVKVLQAGSSTCYFSGCMVRAA